jgi:hypothetical protein
MFYTSQAHYSTNENIESMKLIMVYKNNSIIQYTTNQNKPKQGGAKQSNIWRS